MNYKINIRVYVQLAITNPHEFYTCTHMSASAHIHTHMCTHPRTHKEREIIDEIYLQKLIKNYKIISIGIN